VDESLIGRIPTGEAFRARFGNPYAVIHRADVHLSLLEGAQATGRVQFLTSTRVERVEQHDNGVTVVEAAGNGSENLDDASYGAGNGGPPGDAARDTDGRTDLQVPGCCAAARRR